MVECPREVCDRRPGVLLKKTGTLVLGAFKVTEKTKVNTDFQFKLLGSIISQLQGLDVVVNKPFKGIFCHPYEKSLLYENCPLTTAENIRQPTNTAWVVDLG